MFQLERHLQEWTKRFGPTAAMRNSDIEELAQHVRDSIAALKTKGLDDEEAFLVATHRIGSVGALEQEFAKVNGGRTRGYHVFWMIAGVLLFEVYRLFVAAAATLCEAVAAFAGGSGPVIGYSSAAITTLLWFGLAVWLYRSAVVHREDGLTSRFLTVPRGKWMGVAIVFLVVVSAVTKFGSQMALVTLTPLSDIGRATVILAWANAFFTLLVPIVFLFVMLSIRTKMRELEATE